MGWLLRGFLHQQQSVEREGASAFVQHHQRIDVDLRHVVRMRARRTRTARRRRARRRPRRRLRRPRAPSSSANVLSERSMSVGLRLGHRRQLQGHVSQDLGDRCRPARPSRPGRRPGPVEVPRISSHAALRHLRHQHAVDARMRRLAARRGPACGRARRSARLRSAGRPPRRPPRSCGRCRARRS